LPANVNGEISVKSELDGETSVELMEFTDDDDTMLKGVTGETVEISRWDITHCL